MKLVSLLAVAALAAGIYHYRNRRGRAPSRRAGVDQRLAEAVRSVLAGRTSARVQVRCVDGVVTLLGTLPASERDAVLAATLAMPGVAQVTNLIETTEPVGDLGPMQSGIATGR
ncbi:MAG TPA: BON domain-containing protein [Burkholderiales bacterium]|jgi:osmotically-inducible protein OsmY|nr:BON domain-containing protein [Burkholderiales bacterium]